MRSLEEAYCMWSGYSATALGFTDAELFNFTASIHEKLPREVRDLIYIHLYDVISDQDFVAMAKTISPKAQDGRPKPGGDGTEITWPRFVKPGAVCPEFAEEAVQIFYKQHKDIAITNAEILGKTLDTRFFNLNTTMGMSTLSKLSICIHLGDNYDDLCSYPASGMVPHGIDPTKSKQIDPADIATHLGPLLRPEQRLARNFNLTIVMYTGCWIEEWEWRRARFVELVAKIEATANALRPVIAELKDKSSLVITLGICFADLVDLELEEECLGFDNEKWTDVLQRKHDEVVMSW